MFLGAIWPRVSKMILYSDPPLTIPCEHLCEGILFNHECLVITYTLRLYIAHPKSMTTWLPGTGYYHLELFQLQHHSAFASFVFSEMPKFRCWHMKSQQHHMPNSLYDLYRNWWYSVTCQTALLSLPKFNNLNAWRFHWVFLLNDHSYKM